MLRIGIIGLVLSIILIVAAFIIVLATDVAVEPLSPIICQSPDTLFRETYQTAPGQTEVRFYCSNSDRTDVQDVTGYIVLLLCGVFIPLTLFIMFIVLRARRGISRISMPGAGITLDRSSGSPPISGIPSTSNEDVVKYPGQSIRRRTSVDAVLRDKLDQLKMAHDRGKITYRDYERLRKKLMDELLK
jgi:hypothetical protein